MLYPALSTLKTPCGKLLCLLFLGKMQAKGASTPPSRVEQILDLDTIVQRNFGVNLNRTFSKIGHFKVCITK
jgi:hypothetical protein